MCLLLWLGSLCCRVTDGRNKLGDQFAEVRRLELLEPAATILGRVAPRIGRGANEGANGPAVAVEVDKLHGDDLVDDPWQFARGLLPLELRSPLDKTVELVGDAFKHGDEDDVLS